jgi:hypothetical protein
VHSDVPFVGDQLDDEGEGEVDLDESRDLDIITDWSYKTGSFPLTDSVLQRMMDGLTDDRPKYYFAMAILLLLRASRTPKQEEAFQKLRHLWEEKWFGSTLNYAALRSGAPQIGRCKYTQDQTDWCETRRDFLVQKIVRPEDRERIGIPSRRLSGSGPRVRGGANERSTDDRELLSAASEQESASAPSSVAADKGADRHLLGVLAAAADAAAETGMLGRSARVGAAAETVMSPQSTHLSSQAETPENMIEKPKRRRKSRQSWTVAPSEDAATVDALSPGRGTLNEQGRVVSAKDGRPLKEGNKLKLAYSNNYRDDQNTRRFYGRSLSLGEAFKLAVVCQHAPNLPTDRSGHLESRIALFRTAAYYAMSMDGEDERVCKSSSDFPEFLCFLVQSAKQMRYGWLTRARVYFGNNVFGTKPPTERLRSKCFIISI